MSTLDYVSLALGGGAALAAVIYALYTNHSLSVQVASQATTITVYAGKLSDSDRNALSYQQQRDTEKARADRAESELADVTAQLTSTQQALAKVSEENATNAAELVRTAPDPNALLDSMLASSDRSGVPQARDPSAGDDHQGKPTVPAS